jgi:hypothetical protein
MNSYISNQASNTLENIYYCNKKKSSPRPNHCHKCNSNKGFDKFGDYYYCIKCGKINMN